MVNGDINAAERQSQLTRVRGGWIWLCVGGSRFTSMLVHMRFSAKPKTQRILDFLQGAGTQNIWSGLSQFTHPVARDGGCGLIKRRPEDANCQLC